MEAQSHRQIQWPSQAAKPDFTAAALRRALLLGLPRAADGGRAAEAHGGRAAVRWLGRSAEGGQREARRSGQGATSATLRRSATARPSAPLHSATAVHGGGCCSAAARGPKPGVAPCSPALAPFWPLLAPFGLFGPFGPFWPRRAPRGSRAPTSCMGAQGRGLKQGPNRPFQGPRQGHNSPGLTSAVAFGPFLGLFGRAARRAPRGSRAPANRMGTQGRGSKQGPVFLSPAPLRPQQGPGRFRKPAAAKALFCSAGTLSAGRP